MLLVAKSCSYRDLPQRPWKSKTTICEKMATLLAGKAISAKAYLAGAPVGSRQVGTFHSLPTAITFMGQAIANAKVLHLQ